MIHRTSRRHRILSAGATISAISVLLVGNPVRAGGHGRDTTKTYEVKHAFRLPVQYPAGVQLTPDVSVTTRGNTVAKNPGVNDADNFNINHVIPAAGAAFGRDRCWSIANISDSEANAEGTVNPFGAGAKWITGDYRVWGYADADPVVPGFASANSSITIHAQGRSLLGGVVRFGPLKMTGISGGTSQKCIDPLYIGAIDIDDPLIRLDELLYDATIDLTDGEYLWENNVLHIDTYVGDFLINIPGIVTDESGMLAISLRDGAVTSATATGMFAGITLPTIGETSAFDVNVNNLTDLTLNFPSLDPQKMYDYDWTMASQGEGADSIVPEPAAGVFMLALLGLNARRMRTRR